MYWIILIVLAALIAITIIVTVVTIVKEKKEYKHYELDEAYGGQSDEEDYYDDDDYDDRPPVKKRKQAPAPAPKAAPAVKKRRWKIILENPDTGDRYSYVFYDSIGIGRTTKDVAFEEFLSLPEDRKISKVHCAIVRSKDKLYLRDEGSKNYTFLNGKKVLKPIVIQKEDLISLGETDLEVVKILRETN